MKIITKFTIRNHENTEIKFGIPTTEEEKDEMFRFRYESYIEHKYIEPRPEYNNRDIDEYDNRDNTYYIIAKIDDSVVGCCRIIKDDVLPTRKYCYEFDEPVDIAKISIDKRGEVSRLIARYPVEKILPPHIILIGILYVSLRIADMYNVEGGYGFVTEYLFRTLKKVRIRAYEINPHKLIYNQGYMNGYFYDQNNRIIPIYYKTKEIQSDVERVMSLFISFKKIEIINYET
jgi:hypothetical protein